MPRPPASATLIASPGASRIRDEATRDDVIAMAVEALRRRGHETVEVAVTAAPGEIGEAATAAVAAGHRIVAVAGGDGTVRDAAGPLAGSGIDLAILPCGTGNLYATAVGVPRSVDEALRVLETGVPRPFDLGEVRLVPATAGDPENGLPADPLSFAVACGTGFDARLIAATGRDAKRRYGVAAYFLAASRLLPLAPPRPTVLVIDGVRTELESVVVLVANCGEAIPGRLRPRLPIRADDGQFHVFVLPRGGVVASIRGALELMTAESHGISPSGLAVRLTGREVRVEVSPAEPTQIDGDPFPAAWLDARLRPGALRVIRQ